MRRDVYVAEVLKKYEMLKMSGFWPSEPMLRPKRWMKNFATEDQYYAAVLLDNFTYFDDRLSNQLLIASYDSLMGGYAKGPLAPNRLELEAALDDAVFTPVLGEKPNPSDSGNLFTRKLRQILGVPEYRIVDHSSALDYAYQGGCVVLVDDFSGSGTQFMDTYKRKVKGDDGDRSFKMAQKNVSFTCAFITLICTDRSCHMIHRECPKTAICCTHFLRKEDSFWGVDRSLAGSDDTLKDFLERMSPRLSPSEIHMQSPTNRSFGFESLGLMLGFEHSVPDATLPIFWSPGDENWVPLIERR